MQNSEQKYMYASSTIPPELSTDSHILTYTILILWNRAAPTALKYFLWILHLFQLKYFYIRVSNNAVMSELSI
jgi:hypothetical protein